MAQLYQAERQRRPAEPAQQVIGDKGAPSHPLLDRRPEHEEREQVERQVQEIGVQKHVRHERPRTLERVQRLEAEERLEPRVDQHRLLA